MNIYLDIDGVLIANDNSMAYFGENFLQFILTNWPNSTYWLTNYCWKGENRTLDVLLPKLKKNSTRKMVELIKPTEWDELKTDAINFSKPFLWFDNHLFTDEKDILEHYRALACFRKINLEEDPSQLMDEIVYLRTLA